MPSLAASFPLSPTQHMKEEHLWLTMSCQESQPICRKRINRSLAEPQRRGHSLTTVLRARGVTSLSRVTFMRRGRMAVPAEGWHTGETPIGLTLHLQSRSSGNQQQGNGDPNLQQNRFFFGTPFLRERLRGCNSAA